MEEPPTYIQPRPILGPLAMTDAPIIEPKPWPLINTLDQKALTPSFSPKMGTIGMNEK